MFRSTRRSTVLATLVCSALIVAACAGDDDDDVSSETTSTSVDGEATATTTAETDAGTAPTVTAAGTTEPSAPATTAATSETEEREPGPGERHVDDEGEPVQGGTLVFGLEADTANAWAPYKASIATSGFIPLSAVTDSLFGISEDGETAPLLAESVEHNADYTEWTLQIREGITFHDGTPLDGAAVKFNIDANRGSPLTASALARSTP